MKRALALLLLVPSLCFGALEFGGFHWDVIEGISKPGPNHWVKQNVEITPKGLRFSVRNTQDGWTAGNASTEEKFLYGRFDVTMETNFDIIDDDLIFSPFLYHEKEAGPDGTKEIDIAEIGRWGVKENHPLNFTQWPKKPGRKERNEKHRIPEGTRTLTATVIWTPLMITYLSSTGESMIVTDPEYMCDDPMHLFFDIRFYHGKPKNPEFHDFGVTITNIRYTPL